MKEKPFNSEFHPVGLVSVTKTSLEEIVIDPKLRYIPNWYITNDEEYIGSFDRSRIFVEGYEDGTIRVLNQDRQHIAIYIFETL